MRRKWMKRIAALIVAPLISAWTISSVARAQGPASGEGPEGGLAVGVPTSGPHPSDVLELRPEEIMVARKPKYLYIMWDLYSHQDRFDPKNQDAHNVALRYGIWVALKEGLKKHPKTAEVRLHMVVLKERNEYGGPRWDAVDEWYSFTFSAVALKALKLKEPEEALKLKPEALAAFANAGVK